jgi:hypothetical protein
MLDIEDTFLVYDLDRCEVLLHLEGLFNKRLTLDLSSNLLITCELRRNGFRLRECRTSYSSCTYSLRSLCGGFARVLLILRGC